MAACLCGHATLARSRLRDSFEHGVGDEFGAGDAGHDIDFGQPEREDRQPAAPDAFANLSVCRFAAHVSSGVTPQRPYDNLAGILTAWASTKFEATCAAELMWRHTPG